jgi:hypothetical protein
MARRIAVNIAKLPELLRPAVGTQETVKYSGRRQAFSRSFELGYFDFGFRSQTPLVFSHAHRRTKVHVPVAMNAKAEFFAAMIAVQGPGWPQTTLGR